MELADALRALRTRWWALLLGLAIGAAAGAGVAHLTPPVYTSTTQLFVGTSGTTDNAAAHAGALFTEQRLSSYLELLDSDRLAGEVIQDLGLRTSPAELRSRATARVLPNTVIIQIAVSDHSPAAARAAAAAYGQRFTRDVTTLETADRRSTPTVKVVTTDPARLTTVRTSPDPVRDVALGALLGLLLAGFAVAVAGRLDRAVRAPKDVEDATGARSVGIVLDAPPRARGVRTVDENTVPERALRSLVVNVQATRARVVAVCSPLRGEPRPAVSLALATGLAQAGVRVLLVDADQHGRGAGRTLRLSDGPGLTDVLSGRLEPEAAVQATGATGLPVLPVGSRPADVFNPAPLNALVERMLNTYDMVVVDTPAILPDTDGFEFARAADGCLLVAGWRRSRRDELAAAADRLARGGVPVLGSVLAGVPERTAVRRRWVVRYEPDRDRRASVRDQPEEEATCSVPVASDSVPTGSSRVP